MKIVILNSTNEENSNSKSTDIMGNIEPTDIDDNTNDEKNNIEPDENSNITSDESNHNITVDNNDDTIIISGRVEHVEKYDNNKSISDLIKILEQNANIWETNKIDKYTDYLKQLFECPRNNTQNHELYTLMELLMRKNRRNTKKDEQET